MTGDVLEPTGAVPGPASRRHEGRPALCAIRLKRRLKTLVLLQLTGKRDRILDRQPRTGPDREVRRVGATSHQHDVVVVPPSVGNGLKVEPRHAARIPFLDHQRATIQAVLDGPLEEGNALFGPTPVKAQTGPPLWGAFDDASAGLAVEGIAVKPDPPRVGFDESVGERVEYPARPQPDVLVPADMDVRLEGLRIKPPQPAVDAVAGDDQVAFRELGSARDLGLELNLNPEVDRSFGEDVEHALAADAEAGPIHGDRVLALDVH